MKRGPGGGGRAARSARLLLAGLAALPGGAAAPAERPTPALSLTISGGASLGAYEGGLLYYTLEWLRAAPEAGAVRLATGASAGSVNAVLAVLASCGAPSSPEASLFHRTWVPLGFRELFVPEETTRLGAFSRRHFREVARLVEEAWSRGLPEACDVVLGISATRVEPRHVSVGRGALEVPRVEERFVLRVEGRGPGRPPRLTNYADPGWRGEQLLLPEGEDGEVGLESLRDLLFASSAFPGAFPPVELAHCRVHGRGAGRPGCPAARAERALFVDGGLFDNTPLRLAAWLAAAGLRAAPGGVTAWLAAPRLAERAPPPEVRFAFVSPDVTAYPDEPAAEPDRGPGSLASLLGRVASAFLVTARAKNLYTFVEEFPQVEDQVVVPLRHFPLASSPMLGFFGFFETEFRRFDFHVGMYEARRFIEESVVPSLRRAGLPVPAGPFPGEGPEPPSAEWRPFRCLRAALDGLPGAAEACRGEDLRDFRILAQVSLERLRALCAPARAGEPARGPACERALAPARVPGVAIAPELRRDPGEREAAWLVRLLAAHGFWFRDLGLSRDEGGEALDRIRIAVGEASDAVADAQPWSERAAFRTAARLAADALAYVPAPNGVWLTLGPELEVGYSRGFPGEGGLLGSLRLHAAVQLHGLYAILSTDRTPVAVALLGGAVVAPRALTSLALQPELALRAGYLLSYDDEFGAKACADARSPVVAACSRFTAQAVVGLSLLQVVRFQLALEWYPALRQDASLWAVSPSLGFQIPF